MRRARCTNCGVAAPRNARHCPGCGAGLTQPDLLQPAPTEQVPGEVNARSRGRLLVALGTAAVTLGGLVAGGVWLTGADERAARDAFEAGQLLVAPLVSDLEAAETDDDLTAITDAAEAVAEELNEAADEAVGSDTEFGTPAASVLRHQADFSAAVAALETDADSLSAWAQAAAVTQESADALSDQMPAMRSADKGAADSVILLDEAAAHLHVFVGRSASDFLSATSADLLRQLGGARYTTDVQRIAGNAAPHAAALPALLDSLGSAQGDLAESRPTLEAMGRLLDEVSALGALDAENLRVWPESRVALQTTSAAIPDLTAAGRQAIGNLNQLVATGLQTLADWRVEYAEAVQRRNQDRAVLQRYVPTVRTQLRLWDQARNEASDFVDRLIDRDPIPDFRFFAKATRSRQNIRDTLLYTEVPRQMQREHRALVDLLSRSVRVISIAKFDGLNWWLYCEESPAASCDFRDSDSWQEFSAGSGRLSADIPGVIARWESALSRVRVGVAGRQLPSKPAV